MNIQERGVAKWDDTAAHVFLGEICAERPYNAPAGFRFIAHPVAVMSELGSVKG